MANLVVSRDGRRIQVFELRAVQITLGRKGPPGQDRLHLDDPTVSSDHARLERHGNQYMIQDLRSRNGVILNTQVIPPGRLYPVSPGDCIQICDFVLELRDTAAAPPPAPQPVEGLPSELGGFAFQKIYSPRDVVGGDFFAAVQLGGGRLGLAVGDATAGGRPVVEVTLRCTELARRAAGGDAAPAAAIAEFQRALRKTDSGWSATLIVGALDTARGVFRFANAGHIPPLVFQKVQGGTLERLTSVGEAIGASACAVQPAVWEEKEVALAPGQGVLLVSDGVVNAAPPAGGALETTWKNGIRETLMQFWSRDLVSLTKALRRKIAEAERAWAPFGLDGVSRVAAVHGGRGVKQLLPEIEDALRQFLGGGVPEDDVTIIGFERLR